MKNIIAIMTGILLTASIVNAEEKKTLSNTMGKGECISEHKISPSALGCGIKKLFKKKDGSPNALGKFFNAKSFADLVK